LPPPSWRMRLERFAPPVPKQQLAEYMAGFARGRAALAGVGFRGEAPWESANRKEDCKFEISDLKEERGRESRAPSSELTEQRLPVADRGEDCGYPNSKWKENGETRERIGNSQPSERPAPAAVAGRDGAADERRDIAVGSGLKECLEGTQAQDLGLDWNLNANRRVGRDGKRAGPGDVQVCSGDTNREKHPSKTEFCRSNSQSNASAISPKELAVARELRVGQGPVCGPARVRPEVLERVRRREAARAGSRSP